MRHKFFVLALSAMLSLAAGAGMQALPQSGSSSDQSPSPTPGTSERKASGGRTVVGCVEKSDGGFVLKAADGTYPLDTDRDLTPYLGKRVKISGRWEATGITTTAPINASASEGSQESAAEEGAAPQAFVGDLHLHINGSVIGNCTTEK